jgi:hypothetical protein
VFFDCTQHGLTQKRQADILLYIFKNWEFAQGHTQTDHTLITDENTVLRRQFGASN